MNSSCHVNANSNVILSFFISGCLFTIIGIVLNFCLCLLFCRAKSLFHTPYAVFIIALSIADIIKLTAEYFLHILYFYIQHPYFVCSITWFLTMTSENTSYAFLCALGIERNLKVWTIDRRCLITRRHAYIITIMIVLFVIIYDHPFLFFPYDVSYCFFKLFNQLILFSCNNAYYNVYGYKFSLMNLLFIENIGLNNLILPIFIISINISLIIGLRRRAYQRQHRLGRSKTYDWRERSVILYMFLSSLTFIFLTSPIGILGVWATLHGQHIPTNNLALILDLLEMIHHCSHFPILLMTSSIIRIKTFQIFFQPRLSRQNSFNTSRGPIRKHFLSKTAQITKPTTFLSRNGPQVQPLFLFKPIQYSTPNNLYLNRPATIIRPILSSNVNLPFIRPTIIRPSPPRIIIPNENSLNEIDSITTQRKTPIRISSTPELLSSSSPSIRTLSSINSNHEEIQEKKSFRSYFPCCQQQTIRSLKINNSSNFKFNTRTICIIIILLFIFFLIVIILLIVLIVVVHR
ncbi:unnamed protein product [Rotaria sp. Silwood1]|nr:unnamed protein product [Rotaria sp. Silwood1]CAF1600040.1 unnamed protein product [Rotaria sp. Silwood1]CAF3692941.1 unnamed protein product [Rotaria sp. Silwood1]CAF3761781.1 unnamed protein product [Rotaria sp. Silwood1]CAF4753609.1 unnamed protein product [Rotaria sp. Silwood1]